MGSSRKSLTFIVALLLFTSPSRGEDCVVTNLRETLSQRLGSKVSIEKLTAELAARRSRVPEFEFIRKEAERQGLRVWLFGGTAAGYGHYVKWDLLREAGDLRFQKARFDYDYTNIYRSTQDLDIVVDGTATQAQSFQQALKNRFPYFVGSKATPWEVRSLRESSGDKGAILDDFGFMNQHTDSNSTGMIELTDPPKNESIVRDVRDWANTETSRFLKDLHEDRLTYYFSPTHGKTALAQDGKNPPIFSVVRALTKAFQYDLKIRPEDLAVMQKVIDRFDPVRDLENPDAKRWIEKNGKKLYQHAVNLEFASDALQEIGLKKKLIAISKNPRDQDSLAWWMNKEPLKSKPIRKGKGKTAKELGLDVVAHETNNFLAYESITRAHTGEPNVLISRKNAAGETAALGDGFYTALGTKGARGTGITIRFKVDPNAREGADFTRSGNYVIWKNKNAIRVIPESLDMSPFQYFKFLAQGEDFSADDKALLWKLKRKMAHDLQSGATDPRELKKIRTLVVKEIEAQSPRADLVLLEWIRLEGTRLAKPTEEVETLVKWFQKKKYTVDPQPSLEALEHLAQGTEIESWISGKYIPSILEDLDLDIDRRAIVNALSSSRPDIRKFGHQAIAYWNDKWPSEVISSLKTLSEKARNGPLNRQIAQDWLENDLKTNSMYDLFVSLTEKNPQTLRLLEQSSLESFQFQKIEIPKDGQLVEFETAIDIDHPTPTSRRKSRIKESFEIQLTPVTSLQRGLLEMAPWITHTQTVGGMNHPEMGDWDRLQKFIAELNALDPHYHYRLPTEAEWAWVTRKDRSGAVPLSDQSEILDYAWHGDRNGARHDVAVLKPNSIGLYDVYGSVWEFVDGVDAAGIPNGEKQMAGGSYTSATTSLPTRRLITDRTNFLDTGARLVRTPK